MVYAARFACTPCVPTFGVVHAWSRRHETTCSGNGGTPMTALNEGPDVTALYALSRERTRLTLGMSAAVLAFFLPLPILGGFTSLLDGVLFQGVTVAWVYAFAQFVVAIAGARWYSTWASDFDRRLDAVVTGGRDR